MTGTEQLVSLMCILLAVLIVTFLIMAPSIIQAGKNRRDQ